LKTFCHVLVLCIKPFSAKAAQKQQEAQDQYDSIRRKKAAEKITKEPALQHQGQKRQAV
jgi:hypothetical protein